MIKRLRLLLCLCLACLGALAVASGEATWTATLDRTGIRAGEIARVVLTAKLKDGWHAYSIVPVKDGPFPTTIKPPTGDAIESAGPPEEDPPKVELDPNFGKQIGVFDKSAQFYAPIRIKAGKTGAQKLRIDLAYEVCNAANCLPPEPVTFTVNYTIQPGQARPEFTKYVAKTSTQPPVAAPTNSQPGDAASLQIKSAEDAGMLSFIALAFGFGLLSLLTPCVFPMMPITVSFFSKQKAEDQKVRFAGPVAYCLGIIVTFTGLGVIFGSTGLNQFATNAWVNIGLALLFIVLAASLFGVFEIRLPGWLINKANSKSRAGGLAGPFVMGLTFTLTSFTCTVPFVGSLLTASAVGGTKYAIIGMLAYSTAFALPFFLLALFPSFLGRLPRSGAWLVTVKAYMGFLELMAALKFLSNVDLAYSLAWLTRPVFLAVWSATAAVGGLYLLGWLKLPHDGDSKIGWLRRGFGLATVALTLFCLAGMNGVKLHSLEGFLPPDPYPGQDSSQKGPLTWENTYAEAVTKAKSSGKNIFIDFTGIYCTNCRDIEANVFTDPDVEKVLGKFILARLYTDHQGVAADAENKRLQLKLSSGVESLPLYAVVSPGGKVLKIHQQEPPIEDKNQFLNAISPFTASVVAVR